MVERRLDRARFLTLNVAIRVHVPVNEFLHLLVRLRLLGLLGSLPTVIVNFTFVKPILQILIFKRIEVVLFLVIKTVNLISLERLIKLILINIVLSIVELAFLLLKVIIVVIEGQKLDAILLLAPFTTTAALALLPSTIAIGFASAATSTPASTTAVSTLLATVASPSTTSMQPHLILIVNLELFLIRDAATIYANESLS